MNYTIIRPVRTVVADATAAHERAAAALREARVAGDGAAMADAAQAAAMASGTVDMLDRMVEELERTGCLPKAVGLVGGRLSDEPDAEHAAYSQGAAAALSLVTSATRVVAA